MTPFRAAWGRGADWRQAVAACAAGLRDPGALAGPGFVYVGEALADALDLIVSGLVEATGVADWVGTAGAGVCASGREFQHEGAIVALLADLPANSYRLFDGLRPGEPLPPAIGAWTGSELTGVGVVHGDPRERGLPEVIAQLGRDSGAFLVGGLSSAATNPVQIAGRPSEGGLSGLLMSAEVPVVTGITQGCVPIGPTHRVTAGHGPWVFGLDGRAATDVLHEAIGDILTRRPAGISGYIHAALPIAGSDRADYLVRNLLAVDQRRGAIALGQELRCGDQLIFVKRDGAAAQTDLRRMVRDLRARAAGRTIRGALYHSCVARGSRMFGPDSAELRLIEEELGPVPLVGFFTDGEIFHDRLYSYTGVLTLFL